jgi:hypothetical protein
VDKFSTDQERPPIPLVWLVKIGTNLTRSEIVKLENVGFQLPQKERIAPTRIFNTAAPPLDLSGVDVPANPDSYSSSRQSKTTRRSATAPSTKQMQMVASHTSYGRDHSQSHYDFTPWIWLRAHLAIQTSTYTIHLPTDSQFSVRV